MLDCCSILVALITASSYMDQPYPKIAMMWSPIRGDSSIESIAKHDLILLGSGGLGLRYNREPVGFADGFTPESMVLAKQKVAEIRRINPYAVIFSELYFYEWSDQWLPEDHSWWLRVNGKREQFWPGTYRMNWNDPEYRHHVVKWTVSLKEAGVDGVFYDNIRNEPEPWIAFLKEVREAVGDDFLILANAGYAVGDYDFAAPYLNGIMYESGWSHKRTEWDDTIRKMQNTEKLLKLPKISVIERFEEIRDHAGWPGDSKHGQRPEPDPSARRWSLCYALIIGDYYYLFSDNTSHRHDWYLEYDVKIGQPLEEGKKINAHVWQRNYDDALVVVNLPGAKEPYVINLQSPARDSLTGEVSDRFIVPAGDGRIIITKELPMKYNLKSLPAYKLRGVNINIDHGHARQREDIQNLAQNWKANHVRIQIFTAGIPADFGESGKSALEYFRQKVDPILGWCEEFGLSVILDAHGSPGNTSHWTEPKRLLWEDFKWHENFARLWREIAEYYKDNKTIVGYELLNEPNMQEQIKDTPSDWNLLAKKLTSAIREVDDYHTIIVGPIQWSNPNGFISLEPTGDSNTLYTFHMYTPHQFTHQGVHNSATGIQYPGMINNQMWDKEALMNAMKPAIEFQKKHNLPRLYVGEFSSIIWAPGKSSYNYLHDLLEIFEAESWDWAYHAYREWQGWSLEHEAVDRNNIKHVGDTDRLELFKNYFIQSR